MKGVRTTISSKKRRGRSGSNPYYNVVMYLKAPVLDVAAGRWQLIGGRIAGKGRRNSK